MFGKLLKLLMILFLAMSLSACFSSSDSGDDDPPPEDGGDDGDDGDDDDGGGAGGLEPPSDLSVIMPGDDGDGDGAPMAENEVVLDPADFDSDSDYHTDEASVWVHDVAAEPLEMANMLLCAMQNTQAGELVNEDAYLALQEVDACETGERGQSGAGDDDDDGTSFEEWTVLSEREDAESEHVVQFWFQPGAQDAAGTVQENIMGELTITEGVSESNPIGQFEAAFRSEDPDFGIDVLYGSLETIETDDDSLQFEFRLQTTDATWDHGGFAMDQWVHVRFDDPDGDSGTARSYFHFEDDNTGHEETRQFDLATDDGKMLREDSESGEQFCADRSDPDDRVWNYNLYHSEDGEFRGREVSAGERVDLTSGKSFRFEDNGDEYRGYLDYYGVWVQGADEDIDLDGETVFTGGGENREEYTMEVLDGRMASRTRDDISFQGLQGEPLFWFDHSAEQEFLVEIDKDDYDLIKTHAVDWTDDGPEFTEIDDEDITPNDGEQIILFSDSLGDLFYTHEDALPSEDREFAYFNEGQVTTGEDEELFSDNNTVTLWCQWDCLKGGLSQEDIDDENPDDYYHDMADPGGGPFEYQIDAETLELVDMENGSQPVVSLRGLDIPDGHMLQHGQHLTLVTTDYEGEDDYQMAPTSFTWVTGHKARDHRHEMVDADGEAVRIEAPLHFVYTHNVDNDANERSSHDGRQMMLHYEGNHLHGFPWEEDDTGRWYSPVTLADGTPLSAEGNDFVVQALEIEQALNESPDACGDLQGDLPSEEDLPEPDEPEDGVSFDWDDMPEVDGDPRVIDGDLQD